MTAQNTNQLNTEMILRRAVSVYGPKAEQTKLAAIEYCFAHGYDPYRRFGLQIPVAITSSAWAKPSDIDPDTYSETNWQRAIKKIQAQ